MKNNIIKFPKAKQKPEEDNTVISKEEILEQQHQLILQQQEIFKQREKILEIINEK